MRISYQEDFSDKILSTLLQHCRVKYAPCFSCVPHVDAEFSKNIHKALRKFNTSQTEKEGRLQVDPLPCSSGAAVLPIEFNSGWTSEQIVLHASSRLAALIEEVYVDNIETIGEMYFGAAHHESQGLMRQKWIGVGVGWRSITLHRRYTRLKSGVEVSLRTLGKHLQKELCNLRLRKGLDAKFSEDFSSTLEMELPKHFMGEGITQEKIDSLARKQSLELPPTFSGFTLEVLHFEKSVTADAVLDCCIDTLEEIVCSTNPQEYGIRLLEMTAYVEDVHLAVAVIPWKRKDGSSGTCAVGVARLWRDKPVIKDNIPPQIKSSLLEKLLRERICIIRGVDRKIWDGELCLRLQRAYATHDSEVQLAIPTGYSWIRHAAFAVIQYLAMHRFWNVANDVALADTECGQPVKYALAILPSGSVKNTTHLQQKDLNKQSRFILIINTYMEAGKYAEEANTPSGTFAVLVAVVWRDLVAKPTSSITKLKTEKVAIDFLDEAHTEKLFMKEKGNKKHDIEPCMSIRHYNLPPTLLDNKTRELLWPTAITAGLYISGEAPACNRSVLEDYGFTHIVVCDTHSCLFPEDFHYLKLNNEADFRLQVESVYSFITASSPTGEINSSKVLIHGTTGTNHSAAILLGFLMQKNRLNLESVSSFVSEKRSSLNVSDNFWKKLIELEQQIAQSVNSM